MLKITLLIVSGIFLNFSMGHANKLLFFISLIVFIKAIQSINILENKKSLTYK